MPGGSKAPNGEIIAASQGYETKANAKKGIEAIKTHAPNAKVEDHSATQSWRAIVEKRPPLESQGGAFNYSTWASG
jgi:hypothetical protein